jgi:hypothetical protein
MFHSDLDGIHKISGMSIQPAPVFNQANERVQPSVGVTVFKFSILSTKVRFLAPDSASLAS